MIYLIVIVRKGFNLLAITIENKEFESKFLEFAKSQKKAVNDVVIDAMKYFINFKNNETLIYTKKDPLKHLHSITYECDEDLSDVIPYSHIEDSAEYIHNLRQKRNI